MRKDNLDEHVSIPTERAKVRWYWIGVVTYFLIWMNALRFAAVVPYQILVGGAILNTVIIIGFIVLLRRSYRRIKENSAEERRQ